MTIIQLPQFKICKALEEKYCVTLQLIRHLEWQKAEAWHSSCCMASCCRNSRTMHITQMDSLTKRINDMIKDLFKVCVITRDFSMYEAYFDTTNMTQFEVIARLAAELNFTDYQI